MYDELNNNDNNNNTGLINPNAIKDQKSIWAFFISFFLPYVGLIVYFLLRRTKPVLAKSFKIGFYSSIILLAVFIILYFLYLFIFIFYMLSMPY